MVSLNFVFFLRCPTWTSTLSFHKPISPTCSHWQRTAILHDSANFDKDFGCWGFQENTPQTLALRSFCFFGGKRVCIYKQCLLSCKQNDRSLVFRFPSGIHPKNASPGLAPASQGGQNTLHQSLGPTHWRKRHMALGLWWYPSQAGWVSGACPAGLYINKKSPNKEQVRLNSEYTLIQEVFDMTINNRFPK